MQQNLFFQAAHLHLADAQDGSHLRLRVVTVISQHNQLPLLFLQGGQKLLEQQMVDQAFFLRVLAACADAAAAPRPRRHLIHQIDLTAIILIHMCHTEE